MRTWMRGPFAGHALTRVEGELSFPFPFLGAGEAAYFEHAWMLVRFTKVLTQQEVVAIMADAPSLFQGHPAFEADVLSVGSQELVHPLLREAYDADPGDEDQVHGRAFFAAPSRVRRFNAHIEAWLRGAHRIVPIAVAVRPEDDEAGGTRFSAWHDWSVAQWGATRDGWQPLPGLQTDLHRTLLAYASPDIRAVAEVGAPNTPQDVLYLARGRALVDQRALYRAGALALPGDLTLLGYYLYSVVSQRAFGEVDRSLLERAVAAASDPILLLNATSIAHELREPRLGLLAVQVAEAAGPLPQGAHLNAALLVAQQGDADAVRRWGKLATASGDPAAPLLEAVAFVCEGPLEEPVAALKGVAADVPLSEWRDDVVFEPLRGRTDFEAIF